MNDKKVLQQKEIFEKVIIDLSQNASIISEQISLDLSSIPKTSDHLCSESTQLDLLLNITNSIQSLISIYENIYDEKLNTELEIKHSPHHALQKRVKNSLLTSQEKERQRIAADLHDTVVQNLVYLSQQIEIVQKSIDKDIISSKLELASIKKNIKSIINDIRDTIFNLRPMTFDDIGWNAAFIQLKDKIESQSDCKVNLDITVPNTKEQLYLITIYRIIREACINAMKHANANSIDISLKNENNFIIINIKDNGNGFDLNKILQEKSNHFGLKVMKERVLLLSGEFYMNSEINVGTNIDIKIPF